MLKIITGRIKKCNGCSKDFRGSEKSLTSPHDLVVSHLEEQKYTDKKSGRQKLSYKSANVHFHLNIGCIKLKHPNIKLSDFAISDSERSKLSDAHKEKLKTLGMIID